MFKWIRSLFIIRQRSGPMDGFRRYGLIVRQNGVHVPFIFYLPENDSPDPVRPLDNPVEIIEIRTVPEKITREGLARRADFLNRRRDRK